MGSCCGALYRELDIRNVTLKFHDPKAFAESPAVPLFAFIIHRCLMATISVYFLVNVVIQHPTFNVLLHFSYWSLFFVSLYYICGILVSFLHAIKKPFDKSQGTRGEYQFIGHDTSCALKPGEVDASSLPWVNLLSWYHEVVWVCHTLATNTSSVVLAAYFSLWFHHEVSYRGYEAMMQHILPFLSLVIDSVIKGFPVRLLHVVYANVFGFVYVVFTLCYILVQVPDFKGEPREFPSLEFGDQPVIFSAWLSVFIVAGFLVAQIFFYLLHKIQTCLTATK